MQKRARMPRDFNKLAKMVGDIATGQAPDDPDATSGKNPAAVALGKLGGVKGGKARAANMTKKQRSEAAKKAAQARWQAAKN